MKASSLILPAINGIIWGWFAWVGFDLERGVAARVGHNDLEQVGWYVIFPLLMLVIP